MIEKMCKWCKDEFCVNGDCPMRGDYCPTAQYPGVCKYEELVPVNTRLSPLDCLSASLKEAEVYVEDHKLLAVYENFVAMMKDNDYYVEGDKPDKSITAQNERKYFPGSVVNRDECANNPEYWNRGTTVNDRRLYVSKDKKFHVWFEKCNFTGVVLLNTMDYPFEDLKDELKIGSVVSRQQVDQSKYWHCKSFSGEPFNNSACYVSIDGKWVVRFKDGENFAKIAPWYQKEEFQVGKQVHVGAIGESREWVYVGERNGLAAYETRDKVLSVSFRRDSDWGTIMLNRAAVDAANKETNANDGPVTFKEGDEVSLMDLYGNPDWQETFCKDKIAEFRSKDGTLGASFGDETTKAIIYRRRQTND